VAAEENLMRNALVVDDSRAIRSILRKRLTALGFTVCEAGNGEEAIKVLHSTQGISLALVDWNMPVMNGFELLKSIRSEPAYNELVVVMVTTETETPQMMAALEAGANDYIMKPFTDEVIAERLLLLGFQDQLV
jgi:two-component system chemotaxis response regulator CheY